MFHPWLLFDTGEVVDCTPASAVLAYRLLRSSRSAALEAVTGILSLGRSGPLPGGKAPCSKEIVMEPRRFLAAVWMAIIVASATPAAEAQKAKPAATSGPASLRGSWSVLAAAQKRRAASWCRGAADDLDRRRAVDHHPDSRGSPCRRPSTRSIGRCSPRPST